jgi:serine phosphatase RsbU (regulator of sigma subunit)
LDGSSSEGFFRITFDYPITKQSITNAKVEKFTKGLYEIENCKVSEVGDEIIFRTTKGLYTFNPKNKTFEVYNPYKINFLDKKLHNLVIQEDIHKNIWLANATTILKKVNGIYQHDSISLRPILAKIYKIFADKDSLFWLATDEGLFCYNPNYKGIKKRNFPTFIRLVRSISKDSLLYNGGNEQNIANITLPYQNNALRFEYATESYYAEKENQYQYYLEGYENTWSAWTKESKKEYTNLYEGNYCFRVRAKNIYGEISSESSYCFIIKPPFYRTFWAYGVYLLLFGGGIYIFTKLYTRNLIKSKQRLEAIVKQRTEEVMLQNVELEQQKEEILAQSENLKEINGEMKLLNEELHSTLDLANEQKQEIEKQHEDITASIKYAQRIQTAMLPFKDRIAKSLSDFFIFYKPRDIVSGDFYWFQDTNISSYSLNQDIDNAINHNSYVIIAAADCTGHGVPGAFMSMIGNEIINQIVNVHNIYSPETILEKLHLGVQLALKQKESESRDGMDIGVVTLTRHEGVFTNLEFAGAMNPCYWVSIKSDIGDEYANNIVLHKENLVLIEVKGDKHPIGGHSFGNEINQPRIFNKHTLNLKARQMPLTFYLCSDGFQDQFGEITQRKFMTKKFKELLLSISEEPLHEQQNLLESTFTNWKGKHKQIDDVLVIGVKI